MARKCHLKERMLLCCNSSRGQNKSCYWLEMISQCPVRGVTISVVTSDSPDRADRRQVRAWLSFVTF